MRATRITCLLLAVEVLNAQQSAAPKRQAPPKQETGSIQGRVVNTVTGEAVKKADVVLSRNESQQNQSYTTITSTSGWFAMQDVEPGRYNLSVSKRGYAHLRYGAHEPGRAGAALSLDPGQHLDDITLRMSPQAVIAGRVLDEDGDPVPFIGVQLMHYTYRKGKRKLEPWDSAGTNDLGEYRLFGLSPGRYYLTATPFDRPRLTGGQGYAPTYYPGTSDPAGATALELQSGTVLRGVDVTLTRTRTVRLRGRVVDPTASATMGAYVMLTPREDAESMFEGQNGANMDSQGNFEFPSVVPGAYFVQATKNAGANKTYTATQAVDARANDVENIVLELAPAAELKGYLRVEGRALTSLGDLQVTLQPDGTIYGWAGGQVKADGTFTITNVTPTHYELNVHGFSSDYYVKSAALGGKDILEGGFTFAPGTNGAIDIVLSGTGGQVEGVVLNADQQPTAAAVVAVPDEPRRAQWRFYKDDRTDQYGRFAIKGLAPGKYKLFAWEDVEEGAYQDPEFIRKFEPLGEAVAIRENSRESAQLKLIPAAEKKAAK